MIYVETGISPTEWFRANPPVPIIDEIDIVNIQLPKSELHKRIERRTDRMIAEGLVDEVKYLIEKYQDNLVPIKGIGIRETLDYLRGKIKTISELKDIIALHTRQLAKRQNTFNRTQFKNQKVISLVGDELYLEKNIF
jgi:tRNA dimethylallyltransferase